MAQSTGRTETITTETASSQEISDERQDEPVLSLEGIEHSYGSECVVESYSLEVYDGEILTLLGPSGCGKTTTLRLIAGLESPDAGEIQLHGTVVADSDRSEPPEDRNVGVVFQDFALFPHLTAAENVRFGIDDWPTDERDERVAELLDLVGLADQADAYPGELSGGQQQRIALARSIAPEPDLLLLDEPFSNLDVDLRVEMREEVRRIIKETGVTAISVTHDQEEALSISDRVAVMYDGQLEQVGIPETVFQQPTSRFVAGFLGHASFLSGTVTGDHVDTALGRVLRDDVGGLVEAYDSTEVDLLVRPDDVTAYPATGAETDGEVIYRRYLGPTVLYRVELDDGETIECMHNHSDRIQLGERVGVRVTADHELAWFPADQRESADSAD
ncbi:ABC-type spermidine/putrescine transport system, ATPase component [Halovivax ruber XH-70]|uniref:Molybdate/tungstate import ATP-binding protein WtpC n=1 Tax=Halovivax ruber (strain DSM 18193 / JCM 13892 / XH-70) TaxID=797302 RepID=L0I994_HALRX|nr:ABC transporter ATP-binding protein [Halovivax ruber]AGB15383.1 ABC-type spermidine/putrescine transport system, ATPase component [Halovivax ruber XH-70]